MAENDLTGETGGDAGTTGADTEGVTDTGSQASDTGQSTAAEGGGTTGGDGSQASGGDDLLYNPETYKSLIADLETSNPDLAQQVGALAKSLQGSYTQKTQALSADRQKIEAYDAITRDPHGQLQSMAQRLGYQLTPANGQQQSGDEDFQPQNWQDVFARASEVAERKLMEKLAPVLNQVGEMRKATIEDQLANIDPTWQTYEDQMKQNLDSHPTLANDPATLYRISVPPEVLESRATQEALKKLEAKAKSTTVSGGSTTTKTQPTGMPDGPVSFQEAVSLARKRLQEQGIRPGG